jgi:hypothetical protein
MGLLDSLTKLARKAAPVITAGAALSTGGQSAFLTRLATGASALGGLNAPTTTGSPAPVAIDISPTFAQETPDSGAQIINPMPQQMGIAGGGIVPAVYSRPMPVPPQRGVVRSSGALVPFVAGGSNALARILGFGGAALAIAPTFIDPITGEEKKLRVTRKLRSEVKQAVQLIGIEAVAESMGTDVETVVYILTKRMRNDGPAVTKAALRKTKSTLRKLDAMCDMRDKMRPPARRTTRRAATTKVMQVKN